MPLSYVEQQARERERHAKLAEQQEQRRAEIEAHQQLEAERRQAQAAKEAEHEAWYQQVLALRQAVATGEIQPAAVSDGTVRSLFTSHYQAQDEQRKLQEREARRQERELAAQGVLHPVAQALGLPARSKFSKSMKDRLINPDDYS